MSKKVYNINNRAREEYNRRTSTSTQEYNSEDEHLNTFGQMTI